MAGFVQGNKGASAGVTSTTLAFGAAVTAGNLLAASLQVANTTGVTVSDNVNAGNYSVANNHSTTNTANDLGLWYKENTASGTPTITFSSIPPGDVGVCIGEYNGPLTSSSLDKNGATDANGPSITSGSLTTTGTNGDLLLVTHSSANQNVTVSTSTSGWTLDENNSPSLVVDAVLGSRVQATAGAYTVTLSVTGSAQDMSVVTAAFKLQAVAATNPGIITYAYSSN